MISVRIPRELRRRMKSLEVNWSSIIRRQIEEMVDAEERKQILDSLLKRIETQPSVERGFASKSIREDRDSR